MKNRLSESRRLVKTFQAIRSRALDPALLGSRLVGQLVYLLRLDVPEDADMDEEFGPHDAAWAVRRLLQGLNLKDDWSIQLIGAFAERLGYTYGRSSGMQRNVIETFFLEHLLELETLEPFFAFWGRDPTLKPGLDRALEWAAGHRRTGPWP